VYCLVLLPAIAISPSLDRHAFSTS
jgi:hypothetical protein